MNSHMDVRSYACPGYCQTPRLKGLRNQRTKDVVCGQEKPAFIHQFSKLDFLATRPPIPCSGNHEETVFEQHLHINVVIH